jgi:hypothetical protein
MSFKSGGLGRGLEALLLDISANKDRPVAVKISRSDDISNGPKVINNLPESVEVANKLLLAIRQERLNILAEALALKELMNEIEQQVRDF